VHVQYYKNKMEGLDPSRDPERYSRNEEKLFSVQAAVIEETKSLIHDVRTLCIKHAQLPPLIVIARPSVVCETKQMKGIERAKQTMLERYVPKAVAIQRELWTAVVQHSQHLDALASIARNRRLVPIGYAWFLLTH
jgi:hypothetical protein